MSAALLGLLASSASAQVRQQHRLVAGDTTYILTHEQAGGNLAVVLRAERQQAVTWRTKLDSLGGSSLDLSRWPDQVDAVRSPDLAAERNGVCAPWSGARCC